MSFDEFEQEVTDISNGEVFLAPNKTISKDVETSVVCPACAMQSA